MCLPEETEAALNSKSCSRSVWKNDSGWTVVAVFAGDERKESEWDGEDKQAGTQPGRATSAATPAGEWRLSFINHGGSEGVGLGGVDVQQVSTR